MLLNETRREVLLRNQTNPSSGNNEYNDDEREETLSFCEFSVDDNSDAVDDYSSRDSQKSSSKSSILDEDYFEFATSQEWIASIPPHDPPQSIIFCGKLIAYKQPVTIETAENPEKIPRKSNHKEKGLLRWTWNVTASPCKIKSSSQKGSDDSTLPRLPEKCNGKYIKQKYSRDHQFTVQKMSASSSLGRSRRYFFMFGMTKIPMQMELKDMKLRQSRRRKLFGSEGGDNNRGSMEKSGVYFPRLLRALSCSGHHHANAVINPS